MALGRQGRNDNYSSRPSSDPAATRIIPAAPQLLSSYSCGELEQLWVSQGGNPGAAFIAAEIATAESGGNPLAVSPTADVGLWQINAPSWGSMASTNPFVNARSAIQISGNGTNWGPWTTYTSGAYAGRC